MHNYFLSSYTNTQPQTKHHQEMIKIFTLVYSLTNTVSAVVNGHELAAFPRGVFAVSQHKNKLNVLLNIGDVTHLADLSLSHTQSFDSPHHKLYYNKMRD